jgi:hypothetical protein
MWQLIHKIHEGEFFFQTNSRSAYQAISCPLRNPKDRYRVHKNRQTDESKSVFL